MDATTTALAVSAPATRHERGPDPHVWPPPRPTSVTVLGILGLVFFGLGIITRVPHLTFDGVTLFAFGLETGVSLLLWIGIVRGHPLARGWLLFLGGLYVLGSVIGGVGSLASGGVAEALPLLFVLLVSGAVLYILTRRHVRHFFGMTCPRCSGVRLRPSFLYGRLKCRTCSHQWLRSERAGIDVEAFD